jgi:hypothetical protein
MLFLKTFWKEILIVIIVSSLAISGYNYIYHKGYAEAELVYQKKIDDYNTKLAGKVDSIVKWSTDKTERDLALEASNKLVFDRLIANSKSKPASIIVEGKCIPSPDFIEAINAAVKKANSK